MQPDNFFALEHLIDRQPLTVSPKTPLTEVIGLMQQWGNSCNFIDSDNSSTADAVVGSNNSCVLIVENSRLRGIFTERDLVRLIASGMNAEKITIDKVMSPNIVTLTTTDKVDIFAALSMLQSHRIRHLPVVDAHQNLIGLITAKNLRQKLQPINFMKWRKVAEVMTKEVIHARPNVSIRHLARLMADNNISCVAIAELELNPETKDSLVRPVGIITERDIVQFQHLDVDLEQPAQNFMSAPLFLVSPEDTLWKVQQQMQQRRVRRLLVEGSQGELQGIVTQTSLLQVLDPTEMYGAIEALQQQVCQLEIEKTQLLENRQAELEDEVRKRTAALEDTNQRLKLEANLRHRSEQRFNSILNSLNDVVWSVEPYTFKVIFINSAAEIIYDRPSGEFYDNSNLWLEVVHPEDHDRVLALAQSLLAMENGEIEYRIIRSDGEIRWLCDRARLIRDVDGTPIRLDGIASDITERKQVEAKLQQSNQLLQAISWIQTQFLAAAESAILFDGMLDRLLELTESEYGFIGEILFADDGSPIVEESYMKFRGRPYHETHAMTNIAWDEATRAFYAENAPQGMELHNLQTLFGAVIVTGQPVIANSPSTDSRRGGLSEGHSPLNAFLGLPFYKEDRMTGMVGIANRADGYDEALVEYLQPFLATCSRIIEAHRSERQKQQAEQKIIEQAALLDVATDAIMVRGLDNQILFWNLGATKLYGWTKAEALNQNANELLYQKSSTELAEIQQAVRERGEWRGELNQVTKTGQKVIVESRWTLVKGRVGNPQSYLVVNTNITEKKQLENQFLRTQRLESLGTLAGGIAHDLNNILAPILGFSRLLPLKLPDIDEQTKEFFNIIETNAQRGSALVKQILTFSRGLEGDRGIVQIRHLITEIKQIIEETFPKSIELAINAPKNLWTVNADVNQLHQVLMNLIVNARDAMPDGGNLTIKAENIIVDADYARLHLDASEGSYVLVTVSDTGVGIAPEIIDRIFEPFFTTKEIGRGTGLGLSTVIGIIKSHGGFIDVVSDTQPATKETQIKVFLPAAEITATTAAEEEVIPEGKGELILVVDDESSILEVTKATLETYNYRVLTASNGIEAIATYAHNLNEIALVIMDIMMPSMDGKTAIRALKQIDPQLKIIAVSGLISSQDIAEVNKNVTTFLSKPYSNDELLKTIYEQLAPIRG